MFGGYLFLRFKNGLEIRQINPLQTLINLQYIAYAREWGHAVATVDGYLIAKNTFTFSPSWREIPACFPVYGVHPLVLYNKTCTCVC